MPSLDPPDIVSMNPRRSGKTLAAEQELREALDAGWTVHVVNDEGARTHRKHPSGLVVITPIPRQKPHTP